MIKINNVKINLLSALTPEIFSECLLNYCDKKLISFNKKFSYEAGNSILIQCSNFLIDQGGEFFDNCITKVTDGGRYEQKYIIHVVATKDAKELEKMYYSVFESMIKYQIKMINIELFEFDKIKKKDSLLGLYKAIQKYNRFYSKRIIINLCDENETMIIKNFFDKKINNPFQKIKRFFMINE